MPIGRYPTVRLAHRVSATDYVSLVEHQYEMWPIPFERPQTGSRSVKVECGTCRAAFTYRLFSISATVRRRRLWLGLATACLLISATLFAYVLANDREIGALLALLLPLAFVTALIGMAFLATWTAEDGLRGPNRFNPREVHHISGKTRTARPSPPPG
jgi:hypothetical protein